MKLNLLAFVSRGMYLFILDPWQRTGIFLVIIKLIANQILAT